MGLLVKSQKLPSTVSASESKKGSSSLPPQSPRTHNNSIQNTMAHEESINTSTTGGASGSLSLKNRIRAARKRGFKGDVHDMRFLIEEGPLSFRAFGFVGGFFMILAATLDLVECGDSGDFSPMGGLITFYLWFSGLLAIQLEGRPFHFQLKFVFDFIIEFFNFLRFVWGRGFFYFLSGCLQFFLFTKYNIICGIYFMLLGVFSIVFGYRASVKLAALRNSLSNKADIKFLFHSFDKDRDGYLNSEEFREMLFALDHNLDFNDFVAAMSAVDTENNQRVAYHDLEAWWESYLKSDLPPGTNMYRTISMGGNPSRAQTAESHLMA